MFATNARYKREAYRGSEFAPRILADHDLPVVMKVSFPFRTLNQRITPMNLSHFRAIVRTCLDFLVYLAEYCYLDPVLNSRYLLYEAQQAHYYGLPPNLALASVTTTPAKTMGMDHRIGFLKQGTRRF